MKLGLHIVPDVWKRMFPEDFYYFRVPDEKKSTCSACPKIKSDGYLPSVKCCTYHPRIPNFLLGQALLSDDKDVKAKVEKMIDDGFATPEGLQQTPKQSRESIAENASDQFGKNTAVVCRFLDDGKCGIYLYRNSVCSTFFCKNDQKAGENYWAKVQSLAGQIETALGQWAMEKCGISIEDFFECLNSLDVNKSYDAVTSSWSSETLQLFWGEWYGRERDFYKECARKIEKQEDLYELAQNITLKQPAKYERNLREMLPPDLKAELDSEGPVDGIPVSIEDLWYQLQRAYSDLGREMAGISYL